MVFRSTFEKAEAYAVAGVTLLVAAPFLALPLGSAATPLLGLAVVAFFFGACRSKSEGKRPEDRAYEVEVEQAAKI